MNLRSTDWQASGFFHLFETNFLDFFKKTPKNVKKSLSYSSQRHLQRSNSSKKKFQTFFCWSSVPEFFFSKCKNEKKFRIFFFTTSVFNKKSKYWRMQIFLKVRSRWRYPELEEEYSELVWRRTSWSSRSSWCDKHANTSTAEFVTRIFL